MGPKSGNTAWLGRYHLAWWKVKAAHRWVCNLSNLQADCLVTESSSKAPTLIAVWYCRYLFISHGHLFACWLLLLLLHFSAVYDRDISVPFLADVRRCWARSAACTRCSRHDYLWEKIAEAEEHKRGDCRLSGLLITPPRRLCFSSIRLSLFVCLSVCLSACMQLNVKTIERIFVKILRECIFGQGRHH